MDTLIHLDNSELGGYIYTTPQYDPSSDLVPVSSLKTKDRRPKGITGTLMSRIPAGVP